MPKEEEKKGQNVHENRDTKLRKKKTKGFKDLWCQKESIRDGKRLEKYSIKDITVGYGSYVLERVM